jgi:signal transduction histidine kinase
VPRLIFSDLKRLKHNLYNSLGNALKFTLRGSVSLDVAYDIETKNLVSSIEDKGVGILPEDVDKLF